MNTCKSKLNFLPSSCTGTTEVKTLQLADKSHTVGDLGTVADIGVFSVKGVTYIVTAGTIAGTHLHHDLHL